MAAIKPNKTALQMRKTQEAFLAPEPTHVLMNTMKTHSIQTTFTASPPKTKANKQFQFACTLLTPKCPILILACHASPFP